MNMGPSELIMFGAPLVLIIFGFFLGWGFAKNKFKK